MEDHRLVGVSPAIRELRERIDAIARSDSNVLITGESGSGKEIVARSIHACSPRSSQPSVTINCAGFPDSLLESELFGHSRGAFTGADRDRGGVLEAAHRGTLFMDEVGEMSLRMQAVLLRFLESGEIERVGSDRPARKVDLRVVAATNRDLSEACRGNQFRQELYFRLNVIQIAVPALRERREDIPLLIEWFSRGFSQRYGLEPPPIAPDAVELLLAHHWPGNVRELKNVVERLVVVSASVPVSARDLPPEFHGPPEPAPPSQVVRPPVDDMFDRMVQGGESFWTVVYEPFMARDLTREELRGLIKRGFQHAHGDQSELRRCFNVGGSDHKRFANFVRRFAPLSRTCVC
ncbi:MAG: sigma-54-dependent Fis family transcriptional regulator [Acidobacteria bacterium]|nr:sigma-54-dependent Fis family transcriptional regulator [Acidobacteriota bacterium]